MGDGQVAAPGLIRRKLHDPNIQFEEYLYYAKIQREQEKQGLGPEERGKMRIDTPYATQLGEPSMIDAGSEGDETTEKASGPKTVTITQQQDLVVAPTEWETASRAARNASWVSM
jgi:hypothetical protein